MFFYFPPRLFKNKEKKNTSEKLRKTKKVPTNKTKKEYNLTKQF